MLLKVFSLLVILNYLPLKQGAKRMASLELNSFVCTNHSAPLNRYYCNLGKLNQSLYAFNVEFELSQDLPQNVEVLLKINTQFATGGKIVKFLNIKMKVCDVLSQAMTFPLGRDIMAAIRKTSNIPYCCPIKGNFVYSLKNVTFSQKILPTYAPTSVKFNLTLDFLDKQNVMANVLIQGSTGSRK